MRNKGIRDIEYQLVDNETLNSIISELLNEVCHVFHQHADGNWKDVYKPKYTKLLAEHIAKQPSLIKKLLQLKDPVVKNVTYAAIEFNAQT